MQDYEFLDHELPRSVLMTDSHQGLVSSDNSSSSGDPGTSNSAPLCSLSVLQCLCVSCISHAVMCVSFWQ